MGRDAISTYPQKKQKANAMLKPQINFAEEFKQDIKFKTELCVSYKNNTHCKYGNKCRFAHGPKELFNKSLGCHKYKQTPCQGFYLTGYCLYGSRCHFKHDDREVGTISRSWHTYSLMIGKNKGSRLKAFENLQYIQKNQEEVNKGNHCICLNYIII
jgi:hypothetical protein